MHTLRKQVLALFAAFSTVGGVSAPMMQTAIVQAAQTTTTATINLNIYQELARRPLLSFAKARMNCPKCKRVLTAKDSLTFLVRQT